MAEITPEAIRAYLDLPPGGIKDIGMLKHDSVAAYYGDYSATAKSYKTTGGESDLFKEWSVLFMTVAFLQVNPYAMPRGKASLLIAEFEGTRIDWAEWTAESILREIAANRRKPVPALAHWLAILSPPPPGAVKATARPQSQGSSSCQAPLTASEDVYIPEPLPEVPEDHEQRERRRKGKAPMDPPASTGATPHEPVPQSTQEQREPAVNAAVAVDEEPVLVIQPDIPDITFQEDSGDERARRPKTPWSIGQRVQITPREWDADTPLEAPQAADVPRTPGRQSPNPDLDGDVEILEFIEEVDAHGTTTSIKQRKKKKTSKRKKESGHTSEKSGKKKRRKGSGEASQLTPPAGTKVPEPEPAERITSLPATTVQKPPAKALPLGATTQPQPPQPLTISLVDYTDEESRDPTPEEGILPRQLQPVEEVRAAPAAVPMGMEQRRNKGPLATSKRAASIDQIVMLAEQLLDATCKLKEEHDEDAAASSETAELTKRLGRAEEALKRIRAERDASLRANTEMGQAVTKKEAEIKQVRAELTKAQAYVTEYLMKEDELTREAASAREEADRMRTDLGKHTGEINSLHRRLQLSKKERKAETVAFEQQLRKLRQELSEKEKTWSSKEAKFTTDLTKLQAEMAEKEAQTEGLKAELLRKSNGISELQTRLGQVQAEARLQSNSLQQRKERLNEANKKVTDLLSTLNDRTHKAVMHVKKIVEKFRKQTEEDIEEATATALQTWCTQAAELQMLRADKANRDIKGSGFWKLDKANAEAVQANLTADFQRIAYTHIEEISKLLIKQRDYVGSITEETLKVAEPLRPAAEDSILHILEDDDTENPAESG